MTDEPKRVAYAAIKKAYERFVERANNKHLEIGATGLSSVARLPYYRYDARSTLCL